MLGIARTNAETTSAPERRLDVELTVGELQKAYILAVRERAKTNDQDPDIVSLARKLADYKRRISA